MPTTRSCLTPTELEQFLLGFADDGGAESIETHLGQCSQCQHQLRQLSAEDELVRALRNAVSNANPVDAPSLENVSPSLIDLLVPHFQHIAVLSDTDGAGRAGTDSTASFDAATLHFDSSSEAAREHPEQVGRYEIRGVLGRGGMGEVLHGFDPLLKRSVAIKVMQADIVDDEDVARRIVQEAQSAAAVEHDHIVPIFSVEVSHGHPCIVMPLLKGMSLHERLEQSPGPLSPPEVLRIGREAAEGLAAAHDHGLIHCDIKPANLWLEAPRDRVRILDFGLAIPHLDAGSQRGSISGTPGYLAPEQARGLPLDARTDVFSLGCVLYRMATGQPPFTGDKKFKALWTVLAEPPQASAELNPEIPLPLSDLISRMIAQLPAERPASAQVVVAELEAIEREAVERRTRRLRRRWFTAMLGVAVLSGGGVGLWAFLTAPTQAQPVPITLLGNDEPLAIKLRRDGQETPVTLAGEQVVSLHAGEYSVELVEARPGRELLPKTIVVEEAKPIVVPLVLVGEVVQHAMHTRAATALAAQSTRVDADGTKAARIWSVGLDRTLVNWNGTSSHQPTSTILPHEARCLAATSDGQIIATAGGNKQPPTELAIRLWNARTLTEVQPLLTGHNRLIFAMAFAPQSRVLASAGAEGILIWNLDTGDFQSLPGSDEHAVHAVAFSPDGRELLSAGANGTVAVWNMPSRTLRHSLVLSEETMRAVAFVSSGYLVAGDDGSVREWTAGEAPPRIVVTRPHPVMALAVAPGGDHVIVGDASGTIIAWSRRRQQLNYEFHGHRGAVQALATTSDGRQAVSAGADGTVRLWQLPAP